MAANGSPGRNTGYTVRPAIAWGTLIAFVALLITVIGIIVSVAGGLHSEEEIERISTRVLDARLARIEERLAAHEQDDADRGTRVDRLTDALSSLSEAVAELRIVVLRSGGYEVRGAG